MSLWRTNEVPSSHLDDVVSAEHAAGVASVSVLSDGALHLRDKHTMKMCFLQEKVNLNP